MIWKRGKFYVKMKWSNKRQMAKHGMVHLLGRLAQREWWHEWVSQFEKRYELENGNIFPLLAISGNICVNIYLAIYSRWGWCCHEWWLLAICCVAVLSAGNAYKSGGGWNDKVVFWHFELPPSPPKSCTTSISCSELHAFATEFVEDLLHLIIKHLTPSTMHCNVMWLLDILKCNSNQRGRNCRRMRMGVVGWVGIFGREAEEEFKSSWVFPHLSLYHGWDAG